MDSIVDRERFRHTQWRFILRTAQSCALLSDRQYCSEAISDIWKTYSVFHITGNLFDGKKYEGVQKARFAVIRGYSPKQLDLLSELSGRLLPASCLAVRKDGSAGRLHKSSFSHSALLKCTVFFPMTTQVLLFATI
jgi:hypothetical protein